MKYLAVLLSGSKGILSGSADREALPFLFRLLDQSCTGNFVAGGGLAVRDDFISILPILGYDLDRHYHGEGSAVAARAGVHLEKDDVAFCCDLVNLHHQQSGYEFPKLGARVVLQKLDAEPDIDPIGKELIRELNEQLGTESIVFYPVSGDSHLMVWAGGKSKIQTFFPDDISGKPVAEYLPKGDGAAVLIRCMEVASQFLQQHPLNEERISMGKVPLNGIWLCAPGKSMELVPWEEKYHVRGALIDGSGLFNGIGQLCGLNLIDNPDSSDGPLSERMIAGFRSVSKAFGSEDFVFLHLNVDCSDPGQYRAELDKNFLAPVLQLLDKGTEWRILVLETPPIGKNVPRRPPGPLQVPVSYLIADPDRKSKSPIVFKESFRLMPRFISETGIS